MDYNTFHEHYKHTRRIIKKENVILTAPPRTKEIYKTIDELLNRQETLLQKIIKDHM